MITQELKQAVVDEALKLRKFATKEEKERLDLSSINGFSSFTCVYGQMTGSCSSKRAVELLKSCAKPYSTHNSFLSEDTELKRSFNNRSENKFHDCWYSHLEVYICQDGAKIEDLINLIKS